MTEPENFEDDLFDDLYASLPVSVNPTGSLLLTMPSATTTMSLRRQHHHQRQPPSQLPPSLSLPSHTMPNTTIRPKLQMARSETILT